jgi:2-phospho-L-lactate guanylyltransferase
MEESCPMADVEGASWIVVIPVKRTAIAKSRLATAFPRARPDLALAFAVDTTAAALRTPGVAAVAVVTDDPLVRREVAALGARVLPDEPDAGLNPALTHAVVESDGAGSGVAALSADLPALRPAELAAALAACSVARGYVADAAGTGTTLLAAPPGHRLDPRFGPDSATAHRLSGAVPVELPDLGSLRRDVDTAADLAAAVALGVGPRTAAVLASIGADLSADPDGAAAERLA